MIPFTVEAWVRSNTKTIINVCVNRTPVTGDIYARRDKRDIDVFGCGLHHIVATAPKDQQFEIWLNIITPFMPITSDGKEPDLEPFFSEINRRPSARPYARRVSLSPTGGRCSPSALVAARARKHRQKPARPWSGSAS